LPAFAERCGQDTAPSRAAKLLGLGNPTTLTNWQRLHGVEP
jgi:hypothetical protein